MRNTLSSNRRRTGQLTTHRIAAALLIASLTLALAPLEAVTAIAQGASPTLHPADSMSSTSPLSARAKRPTGIPLGSIEIATPSISETAPTQGTGGGSCDGTDSLQSSGAPFDGGGISGTTSLSCADSNLVSSPLPPSSTIGRVGIPLGATELGGAGISPAAPLADSGLPGSAGPANSMSTITYPGNP